MIVLKTEKIVLLFDQEDSIQKLIDDLALWGIPVRLIQTVELASLSQDERTDTGELIMLRSQNEELLRDVGRLRALSATLGITVLRFEGMLTAEHSSLLLLAGADLCFDGQTKSMEVLAGIQALRRRELALRTKYSENKGKTLVHPYSDSNDQEEERNHETIHGWDLLEDGWRLLTPQRHAIVLTGAERRVLRVLLAESPEPVAREHLLSGKEGGRPPSRYVDVVISRLKGKVAQTGERLPVRSVWGVGYVFSTT